MVTNICRVHPIRSIKVQSKFHRNQVALVIFLGIVNVWKAWPNGGASGHQNEHEGAHMQQIPWQLFRSF